MILYLGPTNLVRGWVRPCVPLHQPFQVEVLKRVPVAEASGTTRRDVRELRREVRRAI